MGSEQFWMQINELDSFLGDRHSNRQYDREKSRFTDS